MEALLEKEENGKFRGWSNIPKEHSVDPKISIKIQEYQRLTDFILRLKEGEKELMKKTKTDNHPWAILASSN